MPIDSRVNAEVERRGLTSIMNETKWRELADAIEGELPFGPPYQWKLVLDVVPDPPDFERDVGWGCEWSGPGMPQYKMIEWLRVRPRIVRDARAGAAGIDDITAEFLAVLRRVGVPHRIDDACVWIYGYGDAATMATLTTGK